MPGIDAAELYYYIYPRVELITGYTQRRRYDSLDTLTKRFPFFKCTVI